MHILAQIGLVLGICWISQCIEQVLPFTLPASVIGMLVLLALLGLRVVRMEHLREKADFLLGNLPFFFVPATVGIMNHGALLRTTLLPLLAVCAVSTVLTFGVTVWTVRWTRRLLERRGRK